MSLTNDINGFASFFLFHRLALSTKVGTGRDLSGNDDDKKNRTGHDLSLQSTMLNMIPEIEFRFIIALVRDFAWQTGPDGEISLILKEEHPRSKKILIGWTYNAYLNFLNMKILIPTVFFFSMMGTVSSAFAQLAWTPEQKAVWQTETTIMELWKTGVLKQEMTYYDSSYHYWDANSPAPINKQGIEKKFKYLNTLGGHLEYFNAVPKVIWVKHYSGN